MPLQKILFKPGVNRENTRYTTEGGWYECDKIRFRQGNPESLGGWVPYSINTFKGICRSLWNWVTLAGLNLMGVGTHLKFYIERGGEYNDITPIQRSVTLSTDPFSADGSVFITVTDTGHGASTGDFVTFSGATGAYATTWNTEYQITVVDVNTYTFIVPSPIPAGSYGGGAVDAEYQVSIGSPVAIPTSGWGAGPWSGGTYGVGVAGSTLTGIRIWTQRNYGEDLMFGPRGGNIYYWDATNGLNSRGVLLNTLGGTVTFTVASPTVVTFTKILTEGTAVQFSVSSGGTLPTGISAATTYYLFNVLGLTANLLDANGTLVSVSGAGSGTFSVSLLVDVPTTQLIVSVSDINRFVLAFGCNDYGNSDLDPMLVRWSDQDNPLVWTPDAANQAGSIRLSNGSSIIAAIFTRQEILIFTDSSLYSFQYLGPPVVWGAQLLADNISIVGPNAVTIASGVVFWMGVDKFYMYDGRVQTLNCDLRRYVFSDFNSVQQPQVYSGTNEGFNEVWWFYPSDTGAVGVEYDEIQNDRYVIYNFLERAWYYGTMARSAWSDSGLRPNPMGTTYDVSTLTGRMISHENGVNDNTDGTTYPLNAYIGSSEFDIGDGHNFGFVWRIIPDLTFASSSNAPDNSPAKVTMTLYPLQNSGSGIGKSDTDTVTYGSAYTLTNTETYTGQVYTRVRGRQMIFRIESNQINTTWQLGAPRIDIRPDGRR